MHKLRTNAPYLVATFLLLAGSVCALPAPQDLPALPSGHVVDASGVIDAASRSKIEGLIQSSPRPLVLATVPNSKMYGFKDIDSLADACIKRWGNPVLLLITTDDHQSRVVQGMDVLSGADIEEVRQIVAPHLVAASPAEYEKALEEAATRLRPKIRAVTKQRTEARESNIENAKKTESWLQILFAILGVLLLLRGILGKALAGHKRIGCAVAGATMLANLVSGGTVAEALGSVFWPVVLGSLALGFSNGTNEDGDSAVSVTYSND